METRREIKERMTWRRREIMKVCWWENVNIKTRSGIHRQELGCVWGELTSLISLFIGAANARSNQRLQQPQRRQRLQLLHPQPQPLLSRLQSSQLPEGQLRLFRANHIKSVINLNLTKHFTIQMKLWALFVLVKFCNSDKWKSRPIENLNHHHHHHHFHFLPACWQLLDMKHPLCSILC